jgi:hypothetical protein
LEMLHDDLIIEDVIHVAGRGVDHMSDPSSFHLDFYNLGVGCTFRLGFDADVAIALCCTILVDIQGEGWSWSFCMGGNGFRVRLTIELQAKDLIALEDGIIFVSRSASMMEFLTNASSYWVMYRGKIWKS